MKKAFRQNSMNLALNIAARAVRHRNRMAGCPVLQLQELLT